MTVQDARRTTPDSSPALACGTRKKLIATTPINRDHIVHPSLLVGQVTQRTQLPLERNSVSINSRSPWLRAHLEQSRLLIRMPGLSLAAGGGEVESPGVTTRTAGARCAQTVCGVPVRSKHGFQQNWWHALTARMKREFIFARCIHLHASATIEMTA